MKLMDLEQLLCSIVENIFSSKFGFSVHIPVNLLNNMNRLRGQQAPVSRTCAQTNKMEFFLSEIRLLQKDLPAMLVGIL